MTKLLFILLVFMGCTNKMSDFDLLTEPYKNMISQFGKKNRASDFSLLCYYSEKVDSWDYPQDTLEIKKSIDILELNITIYSSDLDVIWYYPSVENIDKYESYVDCDSFRDREFSNECPLYASLGLIEDTSDIWGIWVHKDSLKYFYITDANKSIYLD